MAKGIVVVGATFVDIKGFPNDKFIPQGRNSGRTETVHGGVCRNIAEDIANCELKPTFLSLVDDSGTGNDVIDKLKRHKVNTSYIEKREKGMGTWLAVFDDEGDVYASISVRPNLSRIAGIIDEKGDEIFSDCDAIAFEIDLDKQIVSRLLKMAEKYGKKVYCAVSNMSIALERRDYLRRIDCFVCNIQEAGLLFMENYSDFEADEMQARLALKIKTAGIKSMVVTMGSKGAVYAEVLKDGTVCSGYSPAVQTMLKDTTGAGDSFFAGVAVGLTYADENIEKACAIGSKLAASVISTTENVCPRFMPEELLS